MKKRNLFGSMLVFAFASIFVFAACTNKTKQEKAKEDLQEDILEIRQEVEEDMRDFRNYTYAEKEKFLYDANEELKDINEEIDEMKAELDKAGSNISAETRAAYQKGIAELETLRDNYKKNVDKVQNSTEDTWEEVKRDVSNTYEKTKNSIKDAWEDLKRGVTEGVNKAKEKLD